MEAISAASIANISDYNVQSLANTAWAVATLGIFNQPLMDAISKEAIRKISDCEAQNLSNIAWAFATLGLHNVPLLEAISAAAIANISAFNCQSFSTFFWSFSRLGSQNGLTPLLPAALECFLNGRLEADGMSWVDFANAVRLLGHFEGRAQFEAEFQRQLFQPMVSRLAALKGGASSAEAFSDLREFVIRKQVPHLGPVYTRIALRELSVGVPLPRAQADTWATQAREKLRDALVDWNVPTSESILAFASCDVEWNGKSLRIPGRIFASGNTEGIDSRNDVLRPLFRHSRGVDHAERVALLTLLRSVVSGLSENWEECTGTMQLYVSHFPCISCVALFCQLTSCSGIKLEVDFDNNLGMR